MSRRPLCPACGLESDRIERKDDWSVFACEKGHKFLQENDFKPCPECGASARLYSVALFGAIFECENRHRYMIGEKDGLAPEEER